MHHAWPRALPPIPLTTIASPCHACVVAHPLRRDATWPRVSYSTPAAVASIATHIPNALDYRQFLRILSRAPHSPSPPILLPFLSSLVHQREGESSGGPKLCFGRRHAISTAWEPTPLWLGIPGLRSPQHHAHLCLFSSQNWHHPPVFFLSINQTNNAAHLTTPRQPLR